RPQLHTVRLLVKTALVVGRRRWRQRLRHRASQGLSDRNPRHHHHHLLLRLYGLPYPRWTVRSLPFCCVLLFLVPPLPPPLPQLYSLLLLFCCVFLFLLPLSPPPPSPPPPPPP